MKKKIESKQKPKKSVCDRQVDFNKFAHFMPVRTQSLAFEQINLGEKFFLMCAWLFNSDHDCDRLLIVFELDQ
jgi:hypothetical protein